MSGQEEIAPGVPSPGLPVEAALPALRRALRDGTRAVLEAPPGAGKTTLVPLALAAEPWCEGLVVMLEPRRVAARAAAERLAALLGEAPGGRVGHRMRGESRPGSRILVVTEGVLTRMLQADPALEGVSAVIFDEIHERSLQADLGLALALEAQDGLREDLRIVAMSATLEAHRLAAMTGAAVVRSEGRAFPVETRWLARPWKADHRRLEDAAAERVLEALGAAGGSVLAFLPGVGEIARLQRALEGRLPAGVDLRPIHGAMPLSAQRAALAPAGAGRRKVVLATAIAETSLTVEGVTAVVDAGLARRTRFDPGAGLSRLVTEPVSRAEAEQRRGRAGRLGPGLCLRMWTKGEEGALPAQPPAEILTADLAGLALELALWGARPETLAFLDPPPEAALGEARALLQGLEALDEDGRPTPHGRRMAALPAHPRIAHMLLRAAETADAPGLACELAAVLEERDPLGPGAPADLSLRIEATRDPGRYARERPGPPPDARRSGALREAAKRIAGAVARAAGGPVPRIGGGPMDAAALARHVARAYPDRVALKRPERTAGEAPRYLLSGGKGAALPAEDPMGAPRLLAVADTDGDPREARIRRASPLAPSDLEALFGEAIRWTEVCEWSPRERAVVARRRRMFGALALEDRPWRDAPEAARAAAMGEGVRALGLGALPWTGAAARLRARAAAAREAGVSGLPDWSDAALEADLETWLVPHLAGVRDAEGLARLDLAAILEATLDWDARQALDAAAPAAWTAPTGTRLPIDWGAETPTVSVRVQELFGLDSHPVVAGVPLRLELLSPARRPAATTTDLPGFWRGGYADLRKDLRGRYPRHPWPERPWDAAATTRAKPRGG